MLDIIITFRTTFIDSSGGDEITKPKQIAKIYLKGRFWIDFLSAVPFDSIVQGDGSEILKLLGLLKIVRVTRITRIINFMSIKDDMKMVLKLLKLVFFLVLYIHFSACFWWALVKNELTWIPQMDYAWLMTYTYDEFPMFKQYLQ
mmetsp:Transcript_33777/g.38926  ORF Transcript_33777/g.38926 Transcript_33777/m.38926 type:complete len:145 (-) Transcript_33777:1719-2153(-)